PAGDRRTAPASERWTGFVDRHLHRHWLRDQRAVEKICKLATLHHRFAFVTAWVYTRLARRCGGFGFTHPGFETNKLHEGSSIFEAPCTRQASQIFAIVQIARTYLSNSFS